MKYTIYKTFGNTPASIGLDINKHELIAVEYGKDIYSVTDTLIKAVTDDLNSTEEYSKCDNFAYPPKYIDNIGVKADRSKYTYFISGIVSPVYAKENTVVYYGVTETNE